MTTRQRLVSRVASAARAHKIPVNHDSLSRFTEEWLSEMDRCEEGRMADELNLGGIGRLNRFVNSVQKELEN